MVTLAEVKTVADNLVAQGSPISVRTVHQRTKGSFRDVSRYLAKWREASPAASTIPVSDDVILRTEHERLLREAEARLDGERRHLMMQTDAIRQGLGAPHLAKIATLESRVTELQRELAMAEARRDEAERRTAQAERALNATTAHR